MAATQVMLVPTWKKVVVISTLILFFPVGILLMFIWMKWPMWVKLAVIGGVVVLFIPAIAIISAVIVMMINPLELTRRARDAARFTDLATIQSAINTIEERSDVPANWQCAGQTSPCTGTSIDEKAAQIDGSGWIKVDFAKLGIPFPTSPASKSAVSGLYLDPLNAKGFYYRYCSDGKTWEIDAKLESNQMADRAKTDQGDDNTLYEVGSDLTLCK